MVEKLDTCYNVYDIENSTYCTNSFNIKDSSYIHDCKGMEGCSTAVQSRYCTSSGKIYRSENIDNCWEVFSSQNCFESKNIVLSKGVILSEHVYKSTDIAESKIILNSNHVMDSFFCDFCTDLEHGLFCTHANGEFLIFNKPIDETLWYRFKLKLLQYITKPQFVYDWGPVDLVNPDWMPLVCTKGEFFLNQSQELWDWVQTLPYYDSLLLSMITNQLFDDNTNNISIS